MVSLSTFCAPSNLPSINQPKKLISKNQSQNPLENDFKYFLKNNQRPSILFFHAENCSWCKKMEPIFTEIAQNLKFTAIDFYMIDGK